MNIFIVNQNPDSVYDDIDGERYQYPTSIPCGRQIKINDFLIFNYSKKSSNKLGLGNKRIFGIAMIKDITLYKEGEKEMAIATYSFYKKITNILSFNEIGGDPRVNINNAMNKIPEEKIKQILLKIIQAL